MLSNVGIKDAIRTGSFIIDDVGDGALQPASLDVRLGDEFSYALEPNGPDDTIDPFDEESVARAFSPLQKVSWFIIRPGEFVIGGTKEAISADCELGINIDGKSGLARLGLGIHLTAGFIDPGFNGNVTLEFVNHGKRGIVLTPGMFIGQLKIWRLDTPASHGYGLGGNNKYLNATGPQLSRYYLNERPA